MLTSCAQACRPPARTPHAYPACTCTAPPGAGAVRELFAFAPEFGSPLLAPLPHGELLVVQPPPRAGERQLGVFVDSRGRVTRRSAVHWRAPPLACGVHGQQLVTLLPKSVEVHRLKPRDAAYTYQGYAYYDFALCRCTTSTTRCRARRCPSPVRGARRAAASSSWSPRATRCTHCYRPPSWWRAVLRTVLRAARPPPPLPMQKTEEVPWPAAARERYTRVPGIPGARVGILLR